MYLPPTQTDEQRNQIKSRFEDYLDVLRPLMEEYKAVTHWAKIEVPSKHNLTSSTTTSSNTNSNLNQPDGLLNGMNNVFNNNYKNMMNMNSSKQPKNKLSVEDKKKDLRQKLSQKYPLSQFLAYRNAIDPNYILCNRLVKELLFPEGVDDNDDYEDGNDE